MVQGHYEFKVMSYGLTNAPTTFMTLMNNVLRLYLHKFVVIFLDDILICNKTKAEHLRHLKKVFQLLRKHKLYARESKCEVFTEEIDYLSHIISLDWNKNGAKVAAILNWPTPASLSYIQVCLGLSRYYQQFVKNYAKIVVALTNLLKGEGKGLLLASTATRELILLSG